MDPLVRASLLAQGVVRAALGTASVLGLGAAALALGEESPGPWSMALSGVVAAVSGGLLARRLRRADAASAREDFELFAHLAVLAWLLIGFAPGGLRGEYRAGLHALMMLTAAFARPAATLGVLAILAGLEVSVELWTRGQPTPDAAWPRIGWLAAFATLNLVVFRAEIARIRALSRERIEGELLKVKEAARSYRLTGAPGALRPARALADEDRLVHSGVDEVHQSVQLALDLTRHALGAETAALLLLDAGGTRLALQDASSLRDDLLREPFDAQNGVVGAALARRHTVTVVGRQAAQHAPWQPRGAPVGGVACAPLVLPGAPALLLPGAAGPASRSAGPPPSSRTGAAGADLTPRSRALGAVGAGGASPSGEGRGAPGVDARGGGGELRGLLCVSRPSAEPFDAAAERLLEDAARYLVRAMENERVFLQLDRQKSEQGKLYRATERLSHAITEAQVIETGVSAAREIAAFEFAAVTLVDRGTGEHEICAASGEDSERLVGQRFRHNNGLVSMVVQNRHPLPWRGEWDPARQVVFTRRLAPPELSSLLVVPLLLHERALGSLVLGSARKHAFGDAVRPTLEVLASHMAVALSNARVVRRLEELATTDGLTGLYNKRALIEHAQQKLRAAARFGKPLSVLVCDIDFFKKVNDTHGHDIGDLVIKGFGDALRRVKRDTDIVGRFGGEEFVVVCEQTDGPGALLLAERVRAELEKTTFHTDKGSLRVTCSVGVATAPAAGAEWDALFKATDEALYASKHGGRNRVTAWTPKLGGAGGTAAA